MSDLGKYMGTAKVGGPSIFGQQTVSYYQIKGPAPAKNTGADRAFPNGQFGIMIPQVYGRGRVNGNILWYGQATEVASAATLPGGPTAEVAYQGTFAVAICKGEIDTILRVWADDVLIYDATGGGASDIYGTTTLYTGSETQTPDPVMESFEGAGNVPGYRGLAYIVCQDMPLKDFGNKIPAFSFEVQAQTSASVESILNALSAQTGLVTTDFDFGCLDVTVTGYIITSRTQAKSHLDQLLSVFAGDLVEFDGKLQVVQRGGTALTTIPLADLGAKLWTGQDSNPSPAVAVKRMQDLELPFRLDLNYYSSDKGYDPTSTFAVRYDKGDVQGQVTVDTLLVLSENQARQIAERLLYQQWIERTSFEFSLMPSYLQYTPGAVVNLPVDGQEVRVRIVQMDLGLFGPIGVTAVLDDTGILTQSVPGADVETSAPGLANPQTTTFKAFDCVEFDDADAASAGFYCACTGPSGWKSAGIYYSTDAGATYLKAASTGAKSRFGVTSSVLADGVTANAYDGASVTVILSVLGTLSNATLAEVAAGYNWATVGAELLGFTTATLVDLPTRTYTISGLLRGLRGTTMTGHASPEAFVLADAAVRRVSVPSSLIGSSIKVKAVSPGQLLIGVVAQDVTLCAPHTAAALGGYLTDSEIAAVEVTVTAAHPGFAALTNGDPSAPNFVYSPDGEFILVPL